MSLAKLLQSHVVTRGTKFAITARLPSEQLVDLHTDLIDHTAQKVETLDSQDRTTSKGRALVMFKALVLITLGMTGKEAQLMYAASLFGSLRYIGNPY